MPGSVLQAPSRNRTPPGRLQKRRRPGNRVHQTTEILDDLAEYIRHAERLAIEPARSAIAMFSAGVALSSIPSNMFQGRRGFSGARKNAARSAVELLAGRTLTDAEWEQARTRLLEFTNILRSWDNKTKKTRPKVDNVEVLCQREP